MAKIDFAGRTVIVTGAGGGLGRLYALDIARRGGAVVVNDDGSDVDGLNPSPGVAQRVVDEIKAAGGRAVANNESVATIAGANSIVDTALKAFGKIDALINNAGNLRNFWFENFKQEDRDAILATHLIGTFNVTQAVWPHMMKAKYGRIVFASSGAGMFGNQMQSAYGAAKAGITGLMNVLSQEGKPHGIFCNALLPNAESRMGIKMDPKEMEPITAHAANMEGSVTPPFIAPMVVYLASEACITTHDLYSCLGGRFARAFIGVTDGWLGPRDKPASAEDVADHIEQIRDTGHINIPSSLIDEFRIVSEQIKRA